MKCPGCGTNLDVREPVRIPEDAVTKTGTGIIHDRERRSTPEVERRLIEVAKQVRDLGEWSATEDGDLVLTCPDGSTEISYLANRAALVARALTALAQMCALDVETVRVLAAMGRNLQNYTDETFSDENAALAAAEAEVARAEKAERKVENQTDINQNTNEDEAPTRAQQLWKVRDLCRTVGVPIPEWAKDPAWLDGADFTALVLKYTDAVRAILDPTIAETVQRIEKLIGAVREQAIRHGANARDGKCACEVCAALAEVDREVVL